MGETLIIIGIVIVAFGIFGSSQPGFNKPELFRSSKRTIIVFSFGIGLIILGAKIL